MWFDQAKSVWSRLDSYFFNLLDCVHHFKSCILQKTPLKLDIWFQRYGQLKDCTNNKNKRAIPYERWHFWNLEKFKWFQIYNCFIYMYSMKLKSSLLSFIWGVLQWFLKVFTIFFLRKTWFSPISSFRKLEKYKTLGLPPIFSHLNTRF